MISRSFVTVLGAVSAVSAACTRSAACNADDCLRALRATQIPTRLPQASTDCASILDVTVTPSTVTVTQIVTVPETEVVTLPATLTEIIHDTITSEVYATATVDETSTVTVGPGQQEIKYRRAVSTPLPSYATACSVLSRFSSACSCLGVTASTVTAPTPSTTLVLTATRTTLVATTETVETTTEIIVDTTLVQTTTDATATSEVVVTVTSTPPAATPTTILQVYQEGLPQPAYVGQQSNSGGISFSQVVFDLADAIPVTLDSSGHLWYGTYEASSGHYLYAPQPVFFASQPDPNSNDEPWVCSLDASSFLYCSLGGPTSAFVFIIQEETSLLVGDSSDLEDLGNPPPVSVQLVELDS